MPTLAIENILQYPIVQSGKDICLTTIMNWLENGDSGRSFICANPHSLVTADSDPAFRNCFVQADLVTPDGIGIVYASKMLGGNINQRITGSDIFLGLSRLLNQRSGRPFSYFFLGSNEETLSKIRRKLAIEFPHVQFAGSYSPPYKTTFSDEDNQHMIEAINAAKPDILWVGMTAPKQEKWIFQHKNQLDVKFIGAIGAVFDFYAGNVRRSSPIFQQLGLEWLPRLLKEPKRLFKRNFISTPKFLITVFVDLIKHYQGKDRRH